jgi:chemotaxis protein methyltransferase CheR
MATGLVAEKESKGQAGGRGMDKSVFEAFRNVVYEQSGISLNDKKEALVSARVGKRMRALGLSEHKEYLDRVLKDETGEEIVQLLDAISTNLTHFFREEHHFDLLREHIADRLAAGQRRFRVWSAGCSTGEEPYSLAMVLSETCDGYDVDTRILATDISTRVLRHAWKGSYPSAKMDNVSSALRGRYFNKEGRGDEAHYRIENRIRKMILFRRLNLSVVPFPMNGPLDAIFCRNVMIYFDNAVRKELLDECHRLLKPGGYLMVGHAESLAGMLCGFKLIKPSVYVRP